MCQLWNRLVKPEDYRLPKKLLNFEIENESNTKSWFQMLRAVLPVLNISDINTSFVFDIGYSRCILQESEVEWKEALKNKPKLRSYRQFKQSFDTQNYVNLNMSKYQRSLTARLRLGILPIAIETGRFTNTPLNERNCFFCVNKIEDEFHFVCQCKLYSHYHQKLFESMLKSCSNFKDLSDKEKFLKIMESDLRCLHIYLEKAWNTRKTIFASHSLVANILMF